MRFFGSAFWESGWSFWFEIFFFFFCIVLDTGSFRTVSSQASPRASSVACPASLWRYLWRGVSAWYDIYVQKHRGGIRSSVPISARWSFWPWIFFFSILFFSFFFLTGSRFKGERVSCFSTHSESATAPCSWWSIPQRREVCNSFTSWSSAGVSLRRVKYVYATPTTC